MRTLFQVMQKYLTAGDDLILASIIASSGSTPRGAGAHMLVGKNGRLCGTIGGGTVEYRSLMIASDLLEKKESCEHTFTLTHSDIEDIGMVCGGDVNVFFQYLSHETTSLITLAQTVEALFQKRKDIWLISDLEQASGLGIYVPEDGLYGNIKVSASFLEDLPARPCLHLCDHTTLFTEQIGKSETVFVFGGGHISQKLIPFLSAVGFHCIVLDDRPEFTDPLLFPDAVDTILCDFNHLDRSIQVTGNDYCCVLTRGHSYDTAVQAQLLATPACYIGVIGSRAKRASVFRHLVEDYGIAEEELKRITSPIGLDIQAETPEEIAVSITGQLIQVRAENKNESR